MWCVCNVKLCDAHLSVSAGEFLTTGRYTNVCLFTCRRTFEVVNYRMRVIHRPASSRVSLPAEYRIQPVSMKQVSVTQYATQGRWNSTETIKALPSCWPKCWHLATENAEPDIQTFTNGQLRTQSSLIQIDVFRIYACKISNTHKYRKYRPNNVINEIENIRKININCVKRKQIGML